MPTYWRLVQKSLAPSELLRWVATLANDHAATAAIDTEK